MVTFSKIFKNFFVLNLIILLGFQPLLVLSAHGQEISATSDDVEALVEQAHTFIEENTFSPKIKERLDDFLARRSQAIIDEGQAKTFLGRIKESFDFEKKAKEKKIKEREERVRTKQPFGVSQKKERVQKITTTEVEQFFGVPVDETIDAPADSAVTGFLKKVSKAFSLLRGSFGTPKVAHAVTTLPAPTDSGYLAETEEIQFTQAIIEKAALLNNDPLEILNYVRMNVEYMPYFGSKKGADATLVEHSGNDMDQASLLIAMLRQSGIPARYQEANIKLTVRQMLDLLGVQTVDVAAQLLANMQIPGVLVLNAQTNDPEYFILEHTYVEAYIPYDGRRGVESSATSPKTWIPMDPSINGYYYEQLVDLVAELETNGGYTAQGFFDNYLTGTYGNVEPLEAFRTLVTNHLAAYPPTYYPNLTYEDGLVEKYTVQNKLEFIPASLPYKIVTDIEGFLEIPSSYRHTMSFVLEDTAQTSTYLSTTVPISKLANTEFVLRYVASTQDDQDVIDAAGTIYDVSPLSLIRVKPVLALHGSVVAGGGTNDPELVPGNEAFYTMTFTIPTRQLLGSVSALTLDEIIEKKNIVGNTEATAFDTGTVALNILRPSEDTGSTSALNTQKLYTTAQNYLYRLEQNHDELTQIIGGDYLDLVSRATVFNGLDITYDSVTGEPTSFTWQGLRIDSSLYIEYFNRFSTTYDKYQRDFAQVFGLQGSQEESNIFEDDYQVEAVATVKGLRLTDEGSFSGISLKKIDATTESEIDSLSLSPELKTAFHAAVDDGNIIYTPSAPVTYYNWSGVFYINLDPTTGSAGYIIGEGLNGAYTVQVIVIGNMDALLSSSNSTTPLLFSANVTIPDSEVEVLEPVYIEVEYTEQFDISDPITWTEYYVYYPEHEGEQSVEVGYGLSTVVQVGVAKYQLGTKYPGFDELFRHYGGDYGIPPDLLKSMAYQESCCAYDDTLKTNTFDPKAYRYEAHKDYDWYSGPDVAAKNRIEQHPERHFAIGGNAIHGQVAQGDQLPAKSIYMEWHKRTSGREKTGLSIPGNLNPTAQDLYDYFQDPAWIDYRGLNENWNFTPQYLLASSYGILQALYETAKRRMIVLGLELERPATDQNEQPRDAQPVEKLFNPDFSIQIGAGYLKNRYIALGTWAAALLAYNGSPDYVEAVINRWNSGNGIFKEISS